MVVAAVFQVVQDSNSADHSSLIWSVTEKVNPCHRKANNTNDKKMSIQKI
jgi:hypothetical protein